MSETAILFSGGTDSTCAALLEAERGERLHLLTCRRFGVFSQENALVNAGLLRERFGPEKIEHRFISSDALFRRISGERYFHYLRRYGFFVLTVCGACKLAMHAAAILYCLEHRVSRVCDGANRHAGGGAAPDQVPEFIEQVRALYARFAIEYETPVYDLPEPDGIGWESKFGLLPAGGQAILERLLSPDAQAGSGGMTAGRLLHEKGLFAQANVKGTAADRRMQGRCFQVVLCNLFVHGYFLPRRGMEAYRNTVRRYYAEKAEACAGIIGRAASPAFQKDLSARRS